MLTCSQSSHGADELGGSGVGVLVNTLAFVEVALVSGVLTGAPTCVLDDVGVAVDRTSPADSYAPMSQTDPALRQPRQSWTGDQLAVHTRPMIPTAMG